MTRFSGLFRSVSPSRGSRRRAARRAARSRRLAPVAAEVLEERLLLTTFTVTNINDDGGGSLRDAIDDANDNAGSDTIQFDASLSGQTITLTSGTLFLTDTSGTTTIVGLGSDQLIVSGNDNVRVFAVEDDVTAQISGLTIRDGYAAQLDSYGGGGILNQGTLTITGSTISGNTRVTSLVEGTYRDGFTGRGGGGISNMGTLTINNSTISGNTRTDTSAISTPDGGGGIAHGGDGTLTIRNSTISGNTAKGKGGGIYISVESGHATIINSTISGNSAGDGGGICVYDTLSVFRDADRLTIRNSTISGNTDGGGLDITDCNLYLYNTIIASNDGGHDLNIFGIDTDVSGSNNLIEDDHDTDDLTNTITGHDPQLGALQDNGGPTFTQALLAGSLAIDAGGNGFIASGVTTDQRGDGFDRITSGTVDIGAFEFNSGPPETITVTTAKDKVDPNDDKLSLRESVTQANSNGRDDTIQFDAGLAGQTIILTLGQLALAETGTTTIIAGLGSDQLAVSGDDTYRVFEVLVGVTAEIRGLTIRDGSAGDNFGGGIHNAGTLTITDSTLSENTAAAGGGIYNQGTLTITSSTLSGNTASDGGGGIISYGGVLTINYTAISGNSADVGGGIFNGSGNELTIGRSIISGNKADQGAGIYNNGALTIYGSTFSGNSADQGAGIYNSNVGTATVTGNTLSDNSASQGGGIFSAGDLTIAGSTLSGNNASEYGGGIFNEATLTITGSTLSDNTAGLFGGGIYNGNDGTATVINSTISGNKADPQGSGGGIFNHGMLTVTNSTLSGNTADYLGGGIDNYGMLTLNNTIIANSITIIPNSIGGSDLRNFGTITGSNNLIEDGETDGLTNTITGDPNLGDLQDNGGPTFTHALLDGSPAIDTGDDSLIPNNVSTDQRGEGFPRINGVTVDIGAFESQSIFTVTTADDVVNSNDDELSLREAINQANSNAGDDTIEFSAGLAGQTIILLTTAGQLTLTDTTGTTTIAGLGSDQLTVSGGGASRVFEVQTDVTAEISGLTIRDGSADDFGGGINNSGTLTITDSTISGNSASNGGGIANVGTLTITRSTISGNTGSFGGGIYNFETLTMTDSTISGNSADKGGGIANVGVSNIGTLTITRSTISGNTGNVGGGIYNLFGTLTMTDSTLSGNTAEQGAGGGIFNDEQSILTVTNSTISGNTAEQGFGGGIFNDEQSTLTVTNSTISGNTAEHGAGGGIFNGEYSTLTVTNSTISGNTATYLGGGIDNYGTATVVNCTIVGNSAGPDDGGGIFTNNTLTLNNTIVANSTGGDLVNDGDISGNNNLIESGDIDDLTDTITGQDPQLGGLQDNGGPTFTHALLDGSPAIDAGDNSLIPNNDTTDQRGEGFPRINGVTVDIGAFEHPVITVTTAEDTVNSGDGELSLREAINQANSNAGDDTIGFDAGLAGETITLMSGQLTLTDTSGTTTIAGLGSDQLTVSGGNDSQVFEVQTDVTAEISGLTISGGSTDDHGGGIYNSGTLTITGSTISDNTADSGGGIRNQGTLTVSNSTLSGNNAEGSGGGIFNSGVGVLAVTNSTLSGNTADYSGGGIYNYGGTVTITNSTLSGNSAESVGGGILNIGTLALNNTIIANSIGGSDLRNTGGGTMSGSHNLIESGDIGGLTNTITGDPNLGDLQDNGGPTFTHALGEGSLAIDRGDDTVTVDSNNNPLTTDQRGEGFARTVGTVDIGAFEVQTSTAAAATLAVGGEPISDTIALTRGGSLIVAGTNGDDDIFVQQGREPGTIRVIVRTPGRPMSLETFRSGDISRLFISGRGGDDRLINLTSIAGVMWGGGGDDFLFGNQGRSTLFAEAGNDLVVAGAGNDYVDGGDGQDTIFGGSGADRLFGGAGKDTLVGEGGVDTALGQAGQDNILDETGTDHIDGGDAVESLVAGAGIGIFAGEAGETAFTSGDAGSATNRASLDDHERWRLGGSDDTEFDEDEFWSEWDPADNFATLDDELSIDRQLNQLSLV